MPNELPATHPDEQDELIELLSYDEAAAILHVSKRTLQGLVSRREIDHLKIGSKVFFDIRGLEDFIDSARVPATKPAGPPISRLEPLLSTRARIESRVGRL